MIMSFYRGNCCGPKGIKLNAMLYSMTGQKKQLSQIRGWQVDVTQDGAVLASCLRVLLAQSRG